MSHESKDFTANTYQEMAMRTCKSSEKLVLEEKQAKLLNAAIGMTGEAGEVLDSVKKMLFHGHSFDSEKISEEIGDVLWYVAMMCDAIDVNLSDVMEQNIDKLEKRYGDVFSNERSINRDIS